MQKIQVMLEDSLAKSLKDSAKEAGLSTSSYARLLLANAYKKTLTPIQKSLLDSTGDERCSSDDFLKRLDEMIKNA
ncbi:MAG: hypothetical protein O2809_09315 [Proteobacteria bacterium]|nr:hypothetical protein [Pseudomonadota bacterium]